MGQDSQMDIICAMGRLVLGCLKHGGNRARCDLDSVHED